MKLLFSEAQADYIHYIFPYAIWALPDPGETPAMFFARGFLPSSPDLDRFYLCRQIRINLGEFALSSENRRILRKGALFSCHRLPRGEYQCSPEKKAAYRKYADLKFGENVMSEARIDRLLASRAVTDVLVFRNERGAEAGLALLYIEEPALCFYYYAFYDLQTAAPNLGIYMMTSAVNAFAEQGLSHLYLGTCYARKALYKTQFKGFQFFNGFRWSSNLKELKYLLDRQTSPLTQHLLESSEFLNEFYGNDLRNVLQPPI